MFEILKLRLEGLSGYKIARKLNLDPPMVYASLKAAEKNFVVAKKMINELERLGWPENVPIRVKTIQGQKTRRIADLPGRPQATEKEEVVFRLR
jgi:transcriptional regulator